MARRIGYAPVFTLLALSGCATYHSLPLARKPDLASRLGDLRTEIPVAMPGNGHRKIQIDEPLGIDDIGLLAIVNDPDLRSERGRMSAARAGVTQAGVLPDPSVSLSYAAVLGGPGTDPSYTASISQDIASVVTYHTRVQSARAHVGEVDSSLLWQEWQVAQKARLLALDLYWLDHAVGLTRRRLALVSGELKVARSAVSSGNLDLAALAPLLSAQASAEQSLSSLKLERLKNWQDLDAILGLTPDVRFTIAAPRPGPSPDIDSLMANLPERRPDLVALQLGYRSSDEDVRSAILGQFPSLVLGGTWSSDTSAVRTAGPDFGFSLPIFNRNRGQIATARATRLLLHEQYQSRLDSAVGSIRGLDARARALSTDLERARRAARSAQSLSDSARKAYSQGNIDQRALTDYETTTLDRRIKVIDLERSLGEARITLALELAIGLPDTRVAPADRQGTQ
ncbi:MAG: TolC family protein [Arenicellales bacterium]